MFSVLFRVDHGRSKTATTMYISDGHITNQIKSWWQSNVKSSRLNKLKFIYRRLIKDIQLKKFSSNSPSHYKHQQWHSKIRDGIITEIVVCSNNTHIVTTICCPKLLKFVIWWNHKSNHIYWNQIQIKSHVSKSNLCTQIKSIHVIQSWFKSNCDLNLLITDTFIVWRTLTVGPSVRVLPSQLTSTVEWPATVTSYSLPPARAGRQGWLFSALLPSSWLIKQLATYRHTQTIQHCSDVTQSASYFTTLHQ